MSLANGIADIIDSATTADLTKNVYFRVYASAAASPTINGVVVPLVAGTTLDILIKSISQTANVFVMGCRASVVNGNPNAGIIINS
jgi:hypothetical protein